MAHVGSRLLKMKNLCWIYNTKRPLFFPMLSSQTCSHSSALRDNVIFTTFLSSFVFVSQQVIIQDSSLLQHRRSTVLAVVSKSVRTGSGWAPENHFCLSIIAPLCYLAILHNPISNLFSGALCTGSSFLTWTWLISWHRPSGSGEEVMMAQVVHGSKEKLPSQNLRVPLCMPAAPHRH